MEIWKEIPGFPGYEASSTGRIRGVDRVDAAGRRWKGKVLKVAKNNHGYHHVSPSNGPREAQRPVPVHRLVCWAFHGPQPEGMEVNHRDDSRDNNSESNLFWGTHRENCEQRDRKVA